MDLELTLDAREALGKANKRLRRSGVVPGVVYGKGHESTPVQVDGKTFETLYRTAVDRHRGRRPGDRWEGAVRFSERHGLASLHLELSAALQLPDRRHGGREEVDVDETSFELGLRPGISFHLGEHIELFAQARIPLARAGDGAGEGRGGLLGIIIGF